MIDNLKEPHFQGSSLTPGVSGESANAPYGPKAFCAEDISGLKDWGDQHNHAESGWATGAVGDLSQAGMGKSSLRP